jgi:hypothetical protein
MLSPLKAIVYLAIACVTAALPAEEAVIEKRTMPDFSTLLDISSQFLGIVGQNYNAIAAPIVSSARKRNWNKLARMLIDVQNRAVCPDQLDLLKTCVDTQTSTCIEDRFVFEWCFQHR